MEALASSLLTLLGVGIVGGVAYGVSTYGGSEEPEELIDEGSKEATTEPGESIKKGAGSQLGSNWRSLEPSPVVVKTGMSSSRPSPVKTGKTSLERPPVKTGKSSLEPSPVIDNTGKSSLERPPVQTGKSSLEPSPVKVPGSSSTRSVAVEQTSPPIQRNDEVFEDIVRAIKLLNRRDENNINNFDNVEWRIEREIPQVGIERTLLMALLNRKEIGDGKLYKQYLTNPKASPVLFFAPDTPYKSKINAIVRKITRLDPKKDDKVFFDEGREMIEEANLTPSISGRLLSVLDAKQNSEKDKYRKLFSELKRELNSTK